jgi:Spy/CpxP family protein refolding chaperone
MKITISKIKMIVLTSVLSMMVYGAFAQNKEDAPNAAKPMDRHDLQVAPVPPPPPPPPPAPDAPDQLDDHGPMPIDLPDLTADQQAKIKKIDLKNMEAMTPHKNQMREKRAKMATLLSTQPVNLKEADLVAEEIGKIMVLIMKQQIRHDQEIRTILTPDQQIIFDARPKPFLGPGAMKKVRR